MKLRELPQALNNEEWIKKQEELSKKVGAAIDELIEHCQTDALLIEKNPGQVNGTIIVVGSYKDVTDILGIYIQDQAPKDGDSIN